MINSMIAKFLDCPLTILDMAGKGSLNRCIIDDSKAFLIHNISSWALLSISH